MATSPRGKPVIDAAERAFNDRMVDAAPALAPNNGPGRGANIAGVCSGKKVAADGFAVRPPTPLDARSLATLWTEMQRHYGQPVTDATASAAAAFACGAGPATGFDPRTLVAVADTGAVVGALVLNVTFPACELTKSLYIRDLYVARVARRRGVAQALLSAAAALTLSEGFSTLDWTADARNAGARHLYERAGALQVARVYFRLRGSDLLRAAGS